MSEEYPFIKFVACAICEADGIDIEEWEAYEEVAIAAIRAVKDWVEAKHEK